LSQLVAAHAHHDPDVIAFRHKYLGDALVEWADLDTWITARAKLDGEPTTDVTIVLPVSAGRNDWPSPLPPPMGAFRG
jgi:hypothetical protein